MIMYYKTWFSFTSLRFTVSEINFWIGWPRDACLYLNPGTSVKLGQAFALLDAILSSDDLILIDSLVLHVSLITFFHLVYDLVKFQGNLHVTVSALEAAAVVWMSELPSKLNPIILPLMASVKREQVGF